MAHDPQPYLTRDHLMDAQVHQERYIRLSHVQSNNFSAQQGHTDPPPFEVYVLDAPQDVNNPVITPAPQTVNGPSLPLKTLQELRDLAPSSIRVIFYPTDYPDSDNVNGLFELFGDYEFPTAFLAERTLGVTYSFGIRETSKIQEVNGAWINTNCYNSWFHFLAKEIITGDEREIEEIAEDRSWVTAGFFMKWHRHGEGQITLICFWKYAELPIRLEKFFSNPQNISAALENPFVIYVVILDELFTLMDRLVWRVIEILKKIEDEVFNSARGSKRRPALQLDFVILHRLAKHIVYLKESSDAILETISSLQASHEDLLKSCTQDPKPPPTMFIATKRNLLYTEGLFRSINLRLVSVEKRLNNIINLAFNLVTQHDSRAARKNSESMSTIAIMTLIFLPGTAVAAIFSTDFIHVDPDGKIRMSQGFGTFWAFAVPMTFCTFVCWYFWQKWHFGRLRATVFPGDYSATAEIH